MLAGWTGLALILLACIRLGSSTAYPGVAALLPVLGAALVIAAGCARPHEGVGLALSQRRCARYAVPGWRLRGIVDAVVRAQDGQTGCAASNRWCGRGRLGSWPGCGGR